MGKLQNEKWSRVIWAAVELVEKANARRKVAPNQETWISRKRLSERSKRKFIGKIIIEPFVVTVLIHKANGKTDWVITRPKKQCGRREVVFERIASTKQNCHREATKIKSLNARSS